MVPKHYTQRSLFSNFKNLWLQSKALYYYFTSHSTAPSPQPPEDYSLVFSDDFKTIDDNIWRWGQPWGNFHSEQLWWYWPTKGETPSDIAYPNQDGLALELRKYPKEFKRADLPEWRRGTVPNEWTSPIAAGLLCTKKAFRYGWIEAEVKLPVEKAQWSAFWLAGRDTWPPEIDIFEAYTDNDVNKIKVKPNIHWGANNFGPKKDWGAPRIALKDPHKRFIKYACHWTPEFIRFYYDGILVQECTIDDALEQNAQHQHIILNHGCKDPIKEGVELLESVMVVRNLKVYQHKNWID